MQMRGGVVLVVVPGVGAASGGRDGGFNGGC